ncbi:hypothetical protein BHM03_00043510 [Ensete ventricosum]|nr:hypothetical protein BHM03_00043510 [Ensete ventricosum]
MDISYSVIMAMQENNKNELERLDRERHEDFLVMLKGFVSNQVHSLLIYTLHNSEVVAVAKAKQRRQGRDTLREKKACVYLSLGYISLSSMGTHEVMIFQVIYAEKIANVWANVAEETKGYRSQSK